MGTIQDAKKNKKFLTWDFTGGRLKNLLQAKYRYFNLSLGL